ncbi:glutamate-rich protein 5 [Onychostruthus taczanowskii]|uniref:glutamate-rich protein 5 n=1 Tax=Onychostruthus taczanowskii TaxID=356909 RepID=UPI001B80C76B|nr:glutamate-rich protein 5 [Onychostruthus taczanowskii]
MGCSSSARSRAQEPPPLPGETGEQVETELLSETVSEGPETKEEETGEAVDSAAATEIGIQLLSAFLHKRVKNTLQ